MFKKNTGILYLTIVVAILLLSGGVRLFADNPDTSVVQNLTVTLTATPTPPPATKIFSDNFETIFSGWTIAGTANWYTGSPKNGTHSIQLQSLSSIKRTVSTAGYTGISVSFYIGANSLDSTAENMQVSWYDGAAWNLLAQINDGTEDNLLHLYQFALPGTAANNPNFALRFKLNGSSIDDYGYIDNVVVKGNSITATPEPTQAVTPTPSSSKVRFFFDNFETALSGWTITGPVSWYTGSPKNGAYSVQLQSLSSIKQTISTAGYTGINVSFYIGAKSLDSTAENMQVYWYNGTAWNLLVQINDGTEDNLLHPYQFALPGTAADNPNFALRFKLNGNSTDDYGYIDNVAVKGDIVTITPTSSPAETPTPSPTISPSPTPDLNILTINIIGNGSVTPESGLIYEPGTVVDLTAIPGSGYKFDHWEGDLTGDIDNIRAITMDSSKTVTAVFTSITNSWATATYMNYGRRALVAVNLNNKIWAIGGEVDYETGRTEEYDLVSTWTTKANMAYARSQFGGAVLDGKIYAAGGYCSAGFNKIVQCYDPAHGNWSARTSLQTARLDFSLAAANGKIYAFGGFTNSYVVLNSVEEYDPVADTWTYKTPMPGPLANYAVAVLNGKIYIIGGVSDYPPSGVLATVWEYDPVNDSWTTKTSMPTARNQPCAAALNGKIYVMGGINGGNLKTVEEYDPISNTWTSKADMLYTQGGAGAAAANGKIYIVGGVNGSNLSSKIVEAYTP